MKNELEKRRCAVDAIYYCPHKPEDACSCRKPQQGLILKAAEELGIDQRISWLIGDKSSDIEADERAGCRGILVPFNESGLEIGVNEIIRTEARSNGCPL